MIRWAYAINQWKPQFDDFVRREQHERALKTISIAGFEGVELTYGTGRWEPLGNPQQLAANFGSLAGSQYQLETASSAQLRTNSPNPATEPKLAASCCGLPSGSHRPVP